MSVHNEKQAVTLGPTANVAAGGTNAWRAPFNFPGRYRVYAARLITDAAITANGANFSVYTLRNETKARDIATRSFAAGSIASPGAEVLALIPGLNSEVDDGDVLSWTKADSGTGLAGTVRCVVQFERWSG